MKIVRIHFETLSSTNTWAKENAPQFDPSSMTLITANEQTAGRGRFHHQWLSPKNSNLYASFCFIVPPHFPYLSQLSTFFSLITSFTLESFSFKPKIKWPNDLLLSEKKVAGILCETSIIENNCYAIIGVGLNINTSLEEIKKIDRPATSLTLETGKNYSINAILEQLQNGISLNLDLFLNKGLAPFLDDYRTRLNLVEGQAFSMNTSQGKISGIYRGLNPDGSITLELANNVLKKFYSGES
jgi:BirA family transcriptional regulator, biotin operon repressor / biotin---[acetyl-CoA-carboxylase] ligase